jgi:energy-coupling factor transport system ATP-binding protein
MIKLRNVSFTYPAGVTALKDINLDINAGEVVAIIGQNGSGKTTLVKHFNGLLKSSKGEVFVNNQLTNELSTAFLSRFVGYVFQNPDDQIFNNTVFKEVAFGPKNLGLPPTEVKKRVKEALEIVGLVGLEKKHPLDLGLDQKKLLAIASILSMKPNIIILDEPTSGQDHKGIKKVELLINKLRNDYVVVIISHNMELVAKVSTRVVVMCDSEIIFNGKPKEAFVKHRLLSETYLKPPLITQLAQSIKGFKNDVLTIDEFIKELNNYRSSRSR